MSKGRIAVLIPEIYDALDKEFLTGVQTAAESIEFAILFQRLEYILQPIKSILYVKIFVLQ